MTTQAPQDDEEHGRILKFRPREAPKSAPNAGASRQSAFQNLARHSTQAESSSVRDLSQFSSRDTEPGCAVQAALADGSLELPRWNSYLRLARESAFAQRRSDRLLAQQTKTDWKKVTKQLRQRIREKHGED